MITTEVQYDYKYLSQLFSSVEGITIEQYITLQKIEKVKELIVYNELSHLKLHGNLIIAAWPI